MFRMLAKKPYLGDKKDDILICMLNIFSIIIIIIIISFFYLE